MGNGFTISSDFLLSQVSLVRQRLDDLISEDRLLYTGELVPARNLAHNVEVVYFGTIETIRNS